MRTIGEPGKIGSQLHSMGYTHVLIYDLGAQFEREAQPLFKPEDWAALERFRNTELELIQCFGDAYSLYALRDSP